MLRLFLLTTLLITTNTLASKDHPCNSILDNQNNSLLRVQHLYRCQKGLQDACLGVGSDIDYPSYKAMTLVTRSADKIGSFALIFRPYDERGEMSFNPNAVQTLVAEVEPESSLFNQMKYLYKVRLTNRGNNRYELIYDQFQKSHFSLAHWDQIGETEAWKCNKVEL